MTEPTGPRYVLTRAEAIQLRALGRVRKVRASLEPNLYYRHQQMKVADAAIRRAEQVLGEESQSEEESR